MLQGVEYGQGLGGLLNVRSSVPSDIEDPKLYRACQGFEAYFVRYMIQQMRGTTKLMGGEGAGSEIYQGMFDNALGEEIAKNGSVGIAEMMYRQVMKGQGSGIRKAGGFNPAGTVENRIASFNGLIGKASKEFGVDEALIRAVIRNESGGKSRAVSPKGAKGLMQLMDSTARDMGILDSFNAEQNIQAGTGYLRRQLDEFGDIRLALAAYNAGPERVRHNMEIPGIPETREYVEKVMQDYTRYLSKEDSGTDRIMDEPGEK